MGKNNDSNISPTDIISETSLAGFYDGPDLVGTAVWNFNKLDNQDFSHLLLNHPTTEPVLLVLAGALGLAYFIAHLNSIKKNSVMQDKEEVDKILSKVNPHDPSRLPLLQPLDNMAQQEQANSDDLFIEFFP